MAESTLAVADLERQIESLQRKIATMAVIEQAKGVLMHRYSVEATAAFQLLTRWAQTLEVRVAIISELLLEVAGLATATTARPELTAALVAETGTSWGPAAPQGR